MDHTISRTEQKTRQLQWYDNGKMSLKVLHAVDNLSIRVCIIKNEQTFWLLHRSLLSLIHARHYGVAQVSLSIMIFCTLIFYEFNVELNCSLV